MTSNRTRGGGSFRDLRDRHLPVFEWRQRNEPGEEPPQPEAPKRVWKREGILHYAVDDSE